MISDLITKLIDASKNETWLRIRRGKILSQAVIGRCDCVVVDASGVSDPRWPALLQVPIFTDSVHLPGTECLLAFDHLNSVFVLAAEQNRSSQTVIGGVGVSDFVALATLVNAQLQAFATLYNAHTHVGTSPPTTPFVPVDVGSKTVKVGT